ncbi:TolC family protein [Fibrobacter sp. UWR2]|uniref:TolC family protein n=1 Tax=Fibrobacter sp. UWR2 TaxID=1964352 RepID=UPI000B525790|nr:TolC family protein [Fibrobacter sp. UWR2]OWV01968.1 transporter [Fibrobacter sp. UWR2]
MKKCLLYIVSLGALAMASPLTLQEALDMAKSNNSQIKAERAKVDMAESGKTEARSRFMPKISLSASVTKINDPIIIDLSSLQEPLSDIAGAAAYSKAYLSAYDIAYSTAYDNAVKQTMNAYGLDEATAKSMVDQKADEIRSGVMGSKDVGDLAQKAAGEYGEAASKKIKDTDFGMKVQDDVFFNARVTVVWPIFTGLKIYSAYDAAKENVNARKAEFDMAQNAVLMDVATKYFTLRLAEELTVMRETTMKNLEGHLERSKKLEEGGQISKAERLRAEVALAEAQNAYEDALRDQSLARMALASLLRTDTSITATTPVEAPELIRSMEEFKQLAREKHPGLRQLRTERKRSHDAVSAARADWFPTIALFGYRELYTKDLTILEPEWAVGAKAQWDLPFLGGAESRAKVSSAKAMERSLASKEEQTLDNINLLVEKRWRELEHAKGRLASLGKTRELADEALRSQTRAYEAGLATGLDVVDAELALARLQVGDLKAHFDAVVAWLGLLEASGDVAEAGNMLNAVRPVEKNETETQAEVPADTAAAAQPAADQNAASQDNGEQATSPAEATANVQEPAGTTPAQNAEAPAKEEAAKENTEVKK